MGRYQAFQSSINGAAFSPSLGFKVNNKLSMGAGVSAIYTIFNEKIAVNQGAAPDGKVEFEELDDWSAQGFFGLTFQVTDKIMLGGLYRTKSDVDVEGDIKFRNIANPIENRLTSNLEQRKNQLRLSAGRSGWGLNTMPAITITLFADVDWEDWSQFSENTLSVDGTGHGNHCRNHRT